MPPSTAGTRWILVITDHFSRWQDALAIPDAIAPTVATVQEKLVFCYFGLLDVLHSDQGAQFGSPLCQNWGLSKTPHTALWSIGVVERNNRMLGDSLWALLFTGDQTKWDQPLPLTMYTLRQHPTHPLRKQPII